MMNRIIHCLVALAILMLASCTIAPQVVQPKKPSAWATENIIGYDKDGMFVKTDWVRTYHGLLRAYGNKLPINEQVPENDTSGISVVGNKFHVTWVTNKRFADLKYLENASSP